MDFQRPSPFLRIRGRRASNSGQQIFAKEVGYVTSSVRRTRSLTRWLPWASLLAMLSFLGSWCCIAYHSSSTKQLRHLENQRCQWQRKDTRITRKCSSEEWDRFNGARRDKIRLSSILMRKYLFAGGALLWFLRGALLSERQLSGIISITAIPAPMALTEWQLHSEKREAERLEDVEHPLATFCNSEVVFANQRNY